MATVTKVEIPLAGGKTATRFRVRWVDKDGKRRCRNFSTKKAADKKLVAVSYRLETGLAAEGAQVGTLLDAANAWVDHNEDRMKAGNLERSTWEMYESHVRVHIAPNPVAGIQLAKLTPPDCADFAKSLPKTTSVEMARKVFTSFKALLDHAITDGHISVNPAATVSIETNDRKLLSDEDGDRAERAIIPELHESRAVWAAAETHTTKDDGRAQAIQALIMFAGLRISEVRGLCLQHLQLFGDNPNVKVRRRADRWGTLGPPKSKSGYRTIPLGPESVAALRRWLDHVTASPDRLVFATAGGKPYSYAHLYRHSLIPVMETAGLVSLIPKVNNDGAPVVRKGLNRAGPYCPVLLHPTYSFHDFRHVAASIWIAQGLNPKQIQDRMGHSSIKVTMDLYGHLWADKVADQNVARAAENMIFNAVKR
jgi:integrase